jgi:hypothetical protein
VGPSGLGGCQEKVCSSAMLLQGSDGARKEEEILGGFEWGRMESE